MNQFCTIPEVPRNVQGDLYQFLICMWRCCKDYEDAISALEYIVERQQETIESLQEQQSIGV